MLYKFCIFIFRKLDIIAAIIPLLFLIIYFAEFIILSINIIKFKEYRKECPFHIKFDSNYEKRCELFNINANSRYKYQYICSYNPSKDFTLSQKIKDNQIIWTKAKTSIHNIESKDIYYCSRTNIPNKNTYINIKYCNNSIGYKRVIIFFIFYCLLFFLPFIDFYITIFIQIELSNEMRQNRIFRRNPFNLNFHLIRNNSNTSIYSTKASYILNNINFIKEKQKI